MSRNMGVAGGSEMPQSSEDAVYSLVKSIDPRIVPEKRAYAALIGAQSITQVNYVLTQKNNQTHTFPVTPPSPGVVLQKDVVYELESYVIFEATNKGVPQGAAFPRLGIDVAIAKPNPINSMVQNWQVQLNNTTVQWQNVAADDLVHLIETPKTRANRGTTYRTHMFASHDDAQGTTHGLGTMADLQGDGDVPPGAYDAVWGLPPQANVFKVVAANPTVWVAGTIPNSGTVPGQAFVSLLEVAGSNQDALALAYDVGPAGAGTLDPLTAVGISIPGTSGYPFATDMPIATQLPANACPAQLKSRYPIGGEPYCIGGNTAVASGGKAARYCLYTRILDPIQCPPFGYSAMPSMRDQGMWGITNALVIAQLTNPGQARWLQGSCLGGMTSLTYIDWSTLNAQLWFMYLTPPQMPQTLLPSRCVMELLYKQYTQYTPQGSQGIVPAGGKQTITLPNYTFSTVSNALMISVRPCGIAAQSPGSAANIMPFNEADYILAFPDSPFANFQYANMNGLLSNISAQQLIYVGRTNGVKAGVMQYGGLGSRAGLNGYAIKSGSRVGVGGAPIVLRPGIDFPLPMGVVGGTSGNVQIQFQLQVINQGKRDCNVTVTTTSLSTGYFVVDQGQARQMLVGLDEEAVLNAPLGPDMYSTAKLSGGGFMSTLANAAGVLWKHKDTIGKMAGMAKDGYHALSGKGGSMERNEGNAGSKRSREDRDSNHGSLHAALSS